MQTSAHSYSFLDAGLPALLRTAVLRGNGLFSFSLARPRRSGRSTLTFLIRRLDALFFLLCQASALARGSSLSSLLRGGALILHLGICLGCFFVFFRLHFSIFLLLLFLLFSWRLGLRSQEDRVSLSLERRNLSLNIAEFKGRVLKVLLDFTVCTHLAEELSGSRLLINDRLPLLISEVSEIGVGEVLLDVVYDGVKELKESVQFTPVECSGLDGLTRDLESL